MIRRILNTDITFSNYKLLLDLILSKAQSREKLTVTYANSYICITAAGSNDFRDSLRQFDLVHADGIAVHFASKFLYGSSKELERVNGTDLYGLLFSDKRDVKIFIFGGPENCAEILKEKFDRGRRFCGNIHSPGEEPADIKTINNVQPDILLVALGTPKQEEWIIKYKDMLNVPVIIATGSGIDYFTGVKSRAPSFVRKAGLEWLFRLFSEPGRLWKRYLLLNPFFIFKVVLQKVNLMQNKANT
ncbi:MAG TPA: WecB/TagA/CpsF family glycosyltransferase [Ignavibacteria bacterium]|nr:WecB/TagA/CpsF family glycosyltransferase [Ignavibacteria bacterium]